MQMVLMVALGGAMGAVGRYLVAGQVLRLMGPHFPWGTLFVNIFGSFVMGVLVELMALKISVSPEVRVFLITGLLGGFTTFSTFSLDVGLMLERHQLMPAAVYIMGSVVLSVLGLFAGLFLIRHVV